MTLLKHIIYDIETDLKQTFDDRKVSLASIAYWVILVGNKLKGQHVIKRDSGAFMHIFTGVKVSIADSSSNPDIVKNRPYIHLPAGIFDYDKDEGVSYVTYESSGNGSCPPKFTKVTFYRTSPAQAERLYYTKYETPSPANPYFYRSGNYLYFLGVECVNIESVEMGLYTTIPPINEIDINEPLDFPDELLSQLKREVLDLARFSALVPEPLLNDGSGAGGEAGIPTNKIVSVQPQANDQK